MRGKRLMSCLLGVYCFVQYVNSQDCLDSGRKCVDSGQCCGGCCVSGICIDTPRNCEIILDVCKDHVCDGELDCVPYIPSDCPGCEPIATCSGSSADDNFTYDVPKKKLIVNLGVQLGCDSVILCCIFAIVLML